MTTLVSVVEQKILTFSDPHGLVSGSHFTLFSEDLSFLKKKLKVVSVENSLTLSVDQTVLIEEGLSYSLVRQKTKDRTVKSLDTYTGAVRQSVLDKLKYIFTNRKDFGLYRTDSRYDKSNYFSYDSALSAKTFGGVGSEINFELKNLTRLIEVLQNDQDSYYRARLETYNSIEKILKSLNLVDLPLYSTEQNNDYEISLIEKTLDLDFEKYETLGNVYLQNTLLRASFNKIFQTLSKNKNYLKEEALELLSPIADSLKRIKLSIDSVLNFDYSETLSESNKDRLLWVIQTKFGLEKSQSFELISNPNAVSTYIKKFYNDKNLPRVEKNSLIAGGNLARLLIQTQGPLEYEKLISELFPSEKSISGYVTGVSKSIDSELESIIRATNNTERYGKRNKVSNVYKTLYRSLLKYAQLNTELFTEVQEYLEQDQTALSFILGLLSSRAFQKENTLINSNLSDKYKIWNDQLIELQYISGFDYLVNASVQNIFSEDLTKYRVSESVLQPSGLWKVTVPGLDLQEKNSKGRFYSGEPGLVNVLEQIVKTSEKFSSTSQSQYESIRLLSGKNYDYRVSVLESLKLPEENELRGVLYSDFPGFSGAYFIDGLSPNVVSKEYVQAQKNIPLASDYELKSLKSQTRKESQLLGNQQIENSPPFRQRLVEGNRLVGDKYAQSLTFVASTTLIDTTDYSELNSRKDLWRQSASLVSYETVCKKFQSNCESRQQKRTVSLIGIFGKNNLAYEYTNRANTTEKTLTLDFAQNFKNFSGKFDTLSYISRTGVLPRRKTQKSFAENSTLDCSLIRDPEKRQQCYRQEICSNTSTYLPYCPKNTVSGALYHDI